MKFEKFKPENYKNVDIKFTLRLPEELHQDIACLLYTSPSPRDCS
mgnify:CR=1 FL=1